MPTYAAFDAKGRCLYVGMTHGRHPVHRWAEHVATARWAQDAVRWEVLAESEREATVRLGPIHSSLRNAVRVEVKSNDLKRHRRTSADTPPWMLGEVEPISLDLSWLDA